MAPNTRPKSKKCLLPRSLEKRVKASLHVQKPRIKQKKMTEYFPPSPKPNGKSFSEDTDILENIAAPEDVCIIKNISVQNKVSTRENATSPQKINRRRKLTEPKLFCNLNPVSNCAISESTANNLKNVKPILKENSININVEAIEKNPATAIVCSPPSSPLKSAIYDIYKPQRNARRIYLKYGTRIPSFNEIVKSREEFLKFKDDVANVAELQKDPLPQCDKPAFTAASEQNEDISEHLNCKHITQNNLKELFQENTDFLIGIANGTVPCERHALYIQNPYGSSEFDRGELTFNISMSAFSTKQKIFLANLTRKALCAKKLAYNNQYYFKVLLPELCLKIFMQEYNLTKDQATKYLSNPPLP